MKITAVSQIEDLEIGFSAEEGKIPLSPLPIWWEKRGRWCLARSTITPRCTFHLE